MARDDGALVAGLRASEPWAQTALFDRYAPRLERLLRRLIGGDHDVDVADLVHDTFVQAFVAIEQLDDPKALEHDESKAVPVSNGPPQSCDDLYMTQSQQCYDYCGPLTPNGCDCFGCCELPSGGGKYVWLGSVGVNGDTVCTDDQLDNPDVCHPCLPVAACLNECDPCELCVGKTTLPPECDPGEGGGGGTSSGQCDEGIQPCGLPNQPPCPSGQYCITGCCQIVPD